MHEHDIKLYFKFESQPQNEKQFSLCYLGRNNQSSVEACRNRPTNCSFDYLKFVLLYFDIILKSPNWAVEQICSKEGRWFLRTNWNVAICKLDREVRRHPDEVGRDFRAECRDTKVAQRRETKNELHGFHAHSAK